MPERVPADTSYTATNARGNEMTPFYIRVGHENSKQECNRAFEPAESSTQIVMLSRGGHAPYQRNALPKC